METLVAKSGVTFWPDARDLLHLRRKAEAKSIGADSRYPERTDQRHAGREFCNYAAAVAQRNFDETVSQDRKHDRG